MIPSAVLLSGGILIYGLGGSFELHWSATAIFGQALIGFGLVTNGAIGISYLVDSYKGLASAAIVLVLVIRNFFAAGFSMLS